MLMPFEPALEQVLKDNVSSVEFATKHGVGGFLQ